MDAANIFLRNVIEIDFISQKIIKNKLLSADWSLMSLAESKLSRKVSQWESRYNTGTPTVQTTIWDLKEKVVLSSVAKKVMLDENPSPIIEVDPQYGLPTVRKDNTGENANYVLCEICTADATPIAQEDTVIKRFGL